MARAHFYLMGAIATIWGVLSVVEYVLVSYGLELGWLTMYPQDQLTWLASLPAWVHGVWGAQALLALVGALCLLAHLKPAVWMTGLSFVATVVLAIWAHLFAEPSLSSISGGAMPVLVTLLIVVLSATIWLYARGEKQIGEVL